MPLYPPASAGTGTGDVAGPGSSVNTDVAIFSGTTGKIVADSGILIANVARRDAVNTYTISDPFGYNYSILVNGQSTAFYQWGASYASGGDALASGHTIRSNGPGGITLSAYNASGVIRFNTNSGTERGRVHASGGFSWGDTTDPGATNVRIAGTLTVVGTSTFTGTITGNTSGTHTGNVVGGAIGGTTGSFSSSLMCTTISTIGTGTNVYNLFGTSLILEPHTTNNCWISDNIYYNSAFLYKVAGYGAMMYFLGGGIIFRVAASGAAGAALTGAIDVLTITNGGAATFAGSLTVTGNASFGTVSSHIVFTGNNIIQCNTSPGNDTNGVWLTGGGAASTNRGSYIVSYGNQTTTVGGAIQFVGGDISTGHIDFFTTVSGSLTNRMRISRGGGVSIGNTTDPGASNLSVTGTLTTVGTATVGNLITSGSRIISGSANLHLDPVAGNATYINYFAGAGTNFCNGAGGIIGTITSGGVLSTYGYIYPGRYDSPGIQNGWYIAGHGSFGLFSNTGLYLSYGLWTAQHIICGSYMTVGTTLSVGGASTFAGTTFNANITWASGILVMQGSFTSGTKFFYNLDGAMALGVAGTGAQAHNSFWNANGQVGQIYSSGTSTTYQTSSDARLKEDLGLVTDTSVLINTRIHDFKWKTDGTYGRGVFAQEALEINPAAVGIGDDELNSFGYPKRIWGVDYSRYVPDLIVGWQEHEARLKSLEEMIKGVE